MKIESPEQRQQRIANLKARMPCSACKAHGQTTYGHWHSDKECPFFGKTEPKGGKGVFVVAQENDVLSTSSEEVFMVNVSTIYGTNFMPKDQDEDDRYLALSDTCCARTVSGAAWMQNTMQELWKAGHEFYVLPERQAFRFGAGPRIWSEFAVVLPTCLGDGGKSVYIRVSVVPVDVPMLVSRQALLDLGAIMDIPSSIISFKQLGTSMNLETTPSNHLGFRFWKDDAFALPGDSDLWEAMALSEKEVIICETRTKGFPNVAQNTPEPSSKVLGYVGYPLEDNQVHAVGCSSQTDSSSAHSAEATCGSHDFDAGSQAQSGLRFRNRSSDLCDQARADGPLRRPLEGDLGLGEAGEGSGHLADGLAQMGSSVAEGPLRGPGARGSRKASRRSLDKMEARAIDHGNVLVGRRCQDRPADEERPSTTRSPSDVREVRDRNGSSHQPCHQGAVHGMHQVSGMQGDLYTPMQQPEWTPRKFSRR